MTEKRPAILNTITEKTPKTNIFASHNLEQINTHVFLNRLIKTCFPWT